ncbi:conserved hypothetical protein [Histoplasma capsulatum G186AR]|uniref:Mitotic checkpoint regulator, MAD2B-interacting-domain-containing protein n=2 Tax=Ajellomyces capsulatus TaxID=5037 RepID=C0NDA1_AJECG|nr:uncharacterized protein HCBG_01097 [Histoplasma capsulatum G186AR]EEH11642.1 conserved hypothetical protein [Histoplasma capsulatum G186AR]KAG5302512.1 hypothetical protein I7I52_00185 [Histoplasma capsulatum]QSS72088.1 hypothetical protein I7I50_03146 [Histoplasma capsulatum G186AR]
MALVSYSDSEGSDSESTPELPKKKKAAPATLSTTLEPSFQSLTDRGNRRKILVSLPDADKHTTSDAQRNDGDDNGDDGDGPARKRPRIGTQSGGGGAFSSFNSLLPAPKRKGPVRPGMDKKGDGTGAPVRKVFALKTGPEPGFDRQADHQMRWDLSNGDVDSGAIGGVVRDGRDGAFGDGITESTKEKVEKLAVKPKGNAMMFKPLSVARATTMKKAMRKTAMSLPGTTSPSGAGGRPATETALTLGQGKAEDTISNAGPKPKVSLFGLGKEDEQAPSVSQPSSSPYVPLVYSTTDPSTTSTIESSGLTDPTVPAETTEPGPQNQPQTLASIADDLNLTPAQKRQLFGRQGLSISSSSATGEKQSNPNIITFNTDQEYSSNNAFLLSASDAELAAQQHNPVRSIAPGKHSLQQLVNAVSNQRDALEESFAAGKRNKREAGSKYGW